MDTLEVRKVSVKEAIKYLSIYVAAKFHATIRYVTRMIDECLVKMKTICLLLPERFNGFLRKIRYAVTS
jgi:hypothetical protein